MSNSVAVLGLIPVSSVGRIDARTPRIFVSQPASGT